jgi:hypothetical protein
MVTLSSCLPQSGASGVSQKPAVYMKRGSKAEDVVWVPVGGVRCAGVQEGCPPHETTMALIVGTTSSTPTNVTPTQYVRRFRSASGVDASTSS